MYQQGQSSSHPTTVTEAPLGQSGPERPNSPMLNAAYPAGQQPGMSPQQAMPSQPGMSQRPAESEQARAPLGQGPPMYMQGGAGGSWQGQALYGMGAQNSQAHASGAGLAMSSPTMGQYGNVQPAQFPPSVQAPPPGQQFTTPSLQPYSSEHQQSSFGPPPSQQPARPGTPPVVPPGGPTPTTMQPQPQPQMTPLGMQPTATPGQGAQTTPILQADETVTSDQPGAMPSAPPADHGAAPPHHGPYSLPQAGLLTAEAQQGPHSATGLRIGTATPPETPGAPEVGGGVGPVGQAPVSHYKGTRRHYPQMAAENYGMGTAPAQQQPNAAYPSQPGPMGAYPSQPGPMGAYPSQPGPMGAYPNQPASMAAYPGQPGTMASSYGPPPQGAMGGMQPPRPGQAPPPTGQPGPHPSGPGVVQPGYGSPQNDYLANQSVYRPPPPGGVPGQPMAPGNYGMQYGAPGQYPAAGPNLLEGPAGPRKKLPRIDPDKIPSPLDVMEKDQANFQGDQMYFRTLSKPAPPLATTHFIAIDEGNSSPRFIRMVANSIPGTEELHRQSSIPLAAVVQPLANLQPGELPIPVVDHGPDGPIRCRRCKGYINPFVQFVDGGRKFACNLCGFASEVPQDYFCNLDHTGRRADLQERFELQQGTVEYCVSKEYYNRKPTPLRYMFMIDVSYQAIQSGMATAATWTIKNMLDRLPRPQEGSSPAIKVGVMCYDKAFYFFDLRPDLSVPQMLVVGDCQDVFVPLQEGLCVDVEESRELLDTLLTNIPEMFKMTRETEARLGSALQAMSRGLGDHGGKVFAFQMNLPTAEGPGQLKNRDDPKAMGTDKEYLALKTQGDFYTGLGREMCRGGVSVDLFLFPQGFVDVATVGQVASLTGGHVYIYPNFSTRLAGQKFSAELGRAMTRTIGYEGLMRVRSSTGLRVAQCDGNFLLSGSMDMELGALDSDQAISFGLEYDGAPEENQFAYVQVALLYTTSSGERRVRCINMQMKVVSQLNDVFRHAELDTMMDVLARQAAKDMRTTSLKDVKEGLVNKCVDILSSYRRNCATTSSPGQLILPETLKLLPIYIPSLLKSDLLRGGSDMRADLRAESLYECLSMTVPAAIGLYYPRLFNVTSWEETNGQLPPQVRASYERLQSDQVYLLENGKVMYLWLGTNVGAEYVEAIFGVQSLSMVDPQAMATLPEVDTVQSQALRALVDQLRSLRLHFMQLHIVPQRDPSETAFKLLLVEDQGVDSMSYVDFLCFIHRKIQDSL